MKDYLDTIKNDKEIVLKAIKNVPYSLDFASERLQDDKDLSLIAVKGNNMALILISERLSNDPEIVLAACLVDSVKIL